jgi:type I restriction enzyme S subunit
MTFDQLCDIKRGASPRPIHDWLSPSGIPWVKISDATASPSPFISKTAEFIRTEGAKKSVEVFPGDFILSNSATPGIPKFMQIHACVHDGWLLLRNFRGLDQWYCYYLLKNERENLIRQGNGSVFTNLKTEILKKHEVPVPPLDYQKKVAAFLRSLDDRITLLRETNVTLEAIAQALFKSWFVDFDPVHANAGTQAPSLPPEIQALFPATFTDSPQGPIPEGWDVLPFTETINVIGGGTPKTSIAEYWGGDIPWFSVVDAPAESDVFVIDTEKHITELGLNNSSTKLLPSGTTIISARGTVGRLALVGRDMAMNQSCYGLRGKYGDDYFTFFTTYRLVEALKQRSHGSVFDTITRDTLAGVSVVYPDKTVVSAFEDSVGSVMEKIKYNLQQAQTLATTRDTLLPRLISGQLRLPEAEQAIAAITD